MFRSHWLVLFCLILSAGCAGQRAAAPSEAAVGTPTTQPGDARAEQSLDQIVPDVEAALVAPPTTAPTSQPSLEALELYARGRASLANREPPYAAISLLEKAAQLEPHSAAVQYQLAHAYVDANQPEKALRAYERATALRPDWLDAQREKARLQVRFNQDDALRSLVIATRTRDYASNDGDAAAVDYDLAQLLRRMGYDRSAVEQYEKLLWRLSRKSLSVRGHPQVAALVRRPEPVQLELARLYEKRGKFDAAIELYEKIAQSAPDAIEPQARLVRLQLAAGESAPAARRAEEMIRRFRGDPQTIAVFREAYQAPGMGGDDAALAALQSLRSRHPTDTALTRALVELLTGLNRADEAQSIIAAEALRGGANIELLRRLVFMGLKQNDTSTAARTLIAATTASPHMAAEIAPLWSPMVQSWRAAAVRPETLARLALSPEHEPARQYWMARIAAETGRNNVSRSSLAKALQARPVFVPAWLLRVEQIFLDPGEDGEKKAQAEQLIADARSAGEEGLALMLEAITAARTLTSPAELPAFERALAHPNLRPPAEFQLAHAVSLFRAGQAQAFESAIWRLISDHPTFEQAYLLLIGHYTQSASTNSALKVVNTWLTNDPTGIGARLEQADALLAARQQPAAEVLLLDLLDETDADPAVINRMRIHYAQGNRIELFIEELRRRRAQHPTNGNLIEALVATFIGQGQTPAALRELEAAVPATAGQPNLMYFVASLFHMLNEKDRTESIMQQALEVDPKHVSSNNDLAYFWSEAGKNLQKAESMARIAVAAEPDNSAYLDTLGWVLYKQGRFAEARDRLQQAVDNASPLDPVLIDHLADAYYRLGDEQRATQLWRQAQELLGRMSGGREEHMRLRVDLQNKLRQRAEGQPVDVSPVAAE